MKPIYASIVYLRIRVGIKLPPYYVLLNAYKFMSPIVRSYVYT